VAAAAAFTAATALWLLLLSLHVTSSAFDKDQK
jgi:hypothetical protein